ncbi:MAG: prolipoprotein diacylglyceryl transferase [Candidatus Omnitrophica bacterium]|jgi:phosphatidylglycerol:prolipoprotein diacylglycerol transferase|nr:prolipoprotein diacylglyceryl transferase [Candidatus Omnitrophota bacterium]MDD3983579.1 prolipoprotein diacylglyceryl transferase [Candidatus Omnitrophota bacterium]MDD5526948.1 prolipoprotein diacylglyceryl transferase [Candidatus Omnitrophota bacterium]
MHPEICRIGHCAIYSYGAALVSAFWICAFLLRRAALPAGFDPERITGLLFTVFFSGIIGGRVIYILLNLKMYISDPLEIIMLQHGGLAWFGGFMGGAAGGIIYCLKKRMPLLKTIDFISPYIALGHAIGRIGCFFNGCCYGKVSPHGFYFPVHGETLVPVQLYSSLLLVAIFVILRVLQSRPHRPGDIFLFYMMLYSIKRFLIEYLRADGNILLMGLTVFQVFSVIMFLTAVALAVFSRRRAHA